ncbi:MAG: substrate-binding domain-containing protein, partial [Acidobacteria bacterium]|nr:substrate-binding domain-containing protein [Acidobacteriota bacterium]
REVDGALLIPGLHPELFHRYEAIALDGPPIVFADRHIPGLNVDWVVTDNFRATKEAIIHLIEKGHRRIAFFTDFTELTSVLDREAGYRAGLEEKGIAFDEELVCGQQIMRGGAWSYDFALEHCVALSDPVTAVFCINDDIVWGAVQAASRLRLSVPDQVEISGFFDDRIPSGISAPFSRVVQSTFEMGRVSTQMLLERISREAPPEPRHIYLPARLMPGTSE